MKVIALLGVVCAVGSLVGCRSYPVRPMPQISASDAPARTTVNGAKVGGKAYTNGEEINAIFNYNLMSKGVLPVLFVVDNTSGNELDMQRARVELQTPSGQRLQPIGSDAATSGHGRNALAEGVFFFGIFSYDNANKFNEEMRRDWVDKAYPEIQIIGPGRTTSKFFYFSVGKDYSITGSKLLVPITREGGTRQTATLKF